MRIFLFIIVILLSRSVGYGQDSLKWYYGKSDRLILVHQYYISIASDTAIVYHFLVSGAVVTQNIVDTLIKKKSDGHYYGKCFTLKKNNTKLYLTNLPDCRYSLNISISLIKKFKIEELWYLQNSVLWGEIDFGKISFEDSDYLSEKIYKNPIEFKNEVFKIKQKYGLH